MELLLKIVVKTHAKLEFFTLNGAKTTKPLFLFAKHALLFVKNKEAFLVKFQSILVEFHAVQYKIV